MVDMNYVDSSNIEAIGYDAATQDLYVQFLSGSTYIYHGVPQEIYENLMAAPSHGSYLNREIKNVFEYTKE